MKNKSVVRQITTNRWFDLPGKPKLLICLLLVAVAVAGFAQEAAQVAAQTATQETPVRTEHYEVIADAADGQRIAREMESRFALYNSLFRFDPQTAAWPLRVRVFGNQSDYIGYVSSHLGLLKGGAVYLHYADAERRELVINPGSADEAQSLPYQAFTQFLRAFVPNAPAWLREGFAVFFGTVSFGENGTLVFEENLAWLDTVKKLKSPPSPGVVMMADALGAPDNFQALAWSLVSFFLDSGKQDYVRTMTDSFMLLSAEKTAGENAEAVMKRIFLWHNMEELAADYYAYLAAKKSFNELIAEGQGAYSAGKRDEAHAAFAAACDQKPSHYAPWYYLGLLAYDSGETAAAAQHYQAALGLGADNALVLYALGLNSASAGRYGEARDFLRQAAAAAPDRYKAKADALMLKMPEK